MGAALLAVTRQRWATAGVFHTNPADNDTPNSSPALTCTRGHQRPAHYDPGTGQPQCRPCARQRVIRYGRGTCPVCRHRFRLLVSGVVRQHDNPAGRECPGSRRQPAQSAVEPS